MTIPIPILAGVVLLAGVAGAAVLAVAAEHRMHRRRVELEAAQLELEPTTSPTGQIARALEPLTPLGITSGEWPALRADWDHTHGWFDGPSPHRPAWPPEWPDAGGAR